MPVKESLGVFLLVNHQYIHERQKVWIYYFIFVTIIKKESQVFHNILYSCLKKINFSFRTPATPFPPGWLIISKCDFSSRIYDKKRSFFRGFFTRKGFSETKQLSMGRQYLLDSSKFLFLVAVAQVPWQRGLKVSGTTV